MEPLAIVLKDKLVAAGRVLECNAVDRAWAVDAHASSRLCQNRMHWSCRGGQIRPLKGIFFRCRKWCTGFKNVYVSSSMRKYSMTCSCEGIAIQALTVERWTTSRSLDIADWQLLRIYLRGICLGGGALLAHNIVLGVCHSIRKERRIP